MKRILTGILSVACLFAASVFVGCQKEGIVDEGFKLHYAGLTNIGPNMGAVLTPHWFGGEPSDFKVTGVTLDGAAYTGPEFSIDPESGKITVNGYQANAQEGISETPAGEYKVSVSCKVAGSTLSFKDVITVTFFKGVPDGITVTPPELLIRLQDLEEGSSATLPTADVTTDGDHISITGYRIANVRFGEEVIDNQTTKMFEISDKGKISITKGNNFKIGTYVIDLKLNTGSYGNDSEEGLFTDALKVKIVSKPLSISYSPASGIIEEEDETRKTSHASKVPSLTGSAEEVVWSIEKIQPETDKIIIDEATGVISIAEGHGLLKGATYKVDVTVRNKYSDDQGLTLTEAYTIDVVAYIPPIENFAYAASQKKFALAWTAAPDAATTGVRQYSWAEPDADYTDHLALNGTTGEITALKGNMLSVGPHEIKVKAENGKEGGDVTAVLNFTVEENPYYISDFSYGNNLGLTEAQTDGVSQFRFTTKADLVAFSPQIQYGDVLDAEGVTYSFAGKNALNGSNTHLNEANGEISFVDQSAWKDAGLGVAFITAKTEDPADSENSFTVTRPIFFDYANETNAVSITYTPFVLRVNPKDGGRSVVPQITTSDANIDTGTIRLDYRRTFNYYNLEGIGSNGEPLVNGQPSPDNETFLTKIWDDYATATKTTANYSSKDPVAFFTTKSNKGMNKDNLDKSPVYIDNTLGANFGSVYVPPGLWKDETEYADGIFHGQVTFADATESDDVIKYVGDKNNPNRIFPIAIWLDKDFIKTTQD